MTKRRTHKELSLRIFSDSILRASDIDTSATVANLFVAGELLNGSVIGQVIRSCPNLKTVRIERKDNDWDAPQRRITRIIDPDTLANDLQHHPSLQEFSLQGVTNCSIEAIAQALCTCPHLKSVTFKAEDMMDHTEPLLSPETLRSLLSTHRLSLSGIVPETAEFQNVLTEAYVQQACTAHIFLHFSGQTKPSPFAYFLRHVMEWNQSGRHVSFKKASQSLDVAFLLLRENPWLCQRAGTTKTRVGSFWSRLCCVPSR